jgi:beta-phosphoglucomutase
MNKQIAVIWDMDGVITDTGEFHYITWRDTLREIGFELTREAFQPTFGMKNEAIVDNLLDIKPSPDIIETLSLKKEEAFRRDIQGNLSLLPGVRQCLDKFSGLGWKQALASSAPQANIDAILKELGINSYFNQIFSADQPNLPDKSDPTVFLAVSELLGIPPQQCIVIEDSIAGVTGAKRSGMACIAVTTTNPRENLTLADLVLDSLEELTDRDLEVITSSPA